MTKAEAALGRRHAHFLRWSRVALQHATEEMLAEMGAEPMPNETTLSAPLNDNEDDGDERTGDVMRNGLRSPSEEIACEAAASCRYNERLTNDQRRL